MEHAPLLDLPLDELCARARRVRDEATGTRVTYSPKVFIPLTMLCRDRCGYCTFAQPPARLDKVYLAPEDVRSEEHTSELQSLRHLVCRLLLEKKKKHRITNMHKRV